MEKKRKSIGYFRFWLRLAICIGGIFALVGCATTNSNPLVVAQAMNGQQYLEWQGKAERGILEFGQSGYVAIFAEENPNPLLKGVSTFRILVKNESEALLNISIEDLTVFCSNGERVKILSDNEIDEIMRRNRSRSELTSGIMLFLLSALEVALVEYSQGNQQSYAPPPENQFGARMSDLSNSLIQAQQQTLDYVILNRLMNHRIPPSRSAEGLVFLENPQSYDERIFRFEVEGTIFQFTFLLAGESASQTRLVRGVRAQ